MDVKEKLVELLRNSPHLDIIKGYKGNDCTFEQGADWLIANGVTVQEWISVDDRLPEQSDQATAVLGITKHGKCYVVYYYKAAINDEFTGFYDNAIKRAVTHWMPLPQPPKGETNNE